MLEDGDSTCLRRNNSFCAAQYEATTKHSFSLQNPTLPTEASSYDSQTVFRFISNLSVTASTTTGMPPHHPSLPRAASPHRPAFDPWNSSSTGHQRAENRLSGSPSWRESRTLKLREQFLSGGRGGKRMYDTVGAGSRQFGQDGRKENGGWDERSVAGARGKARAEGCGDLRGWLGGVGKVGILRKEGKGEVEGEEAICALGRGELFGGGMVTDCGVESSMSATRAASDAKKPIFANLTIFINGSTAPLVSDHKLKFMLAEHGARVSIALGRRSVTHVILGVPNGGVGMGAGGGLSGSKIEKELRTVRGKGVKFVSVDWWVLSKDSDSLLCSMLWWRE